MLVELLTKWHTSCGDSCVLSDGDTVTHPKAIAAALRPVIGGGMWLNWLSAIEAISLLSLLFTIEILVLVWPAFVQSFRFHQMRNCLYVYL